MIKSIFLGLLIVIAVYTGYVSYHVGAFKPVTINIDKNYSAKVLFIEHTGSYHLINSLLEKLEAKLTKNNISCSKSFGQYFDDPRVIDEDRLKSHTGCLIAPTFSPSPEFLQNLGTIDDKKIQTKEITISNFVHAYFTGSPAIGPYKVYSKVDTFVKENNLKSTNAVLEIYTRQGESIVTDYYFTFDKG